jgi:hypothetical protein
MLPIENLENDESLEEFIEAFASLGFSLCANASFEAGYFKIAIYIGEDGMPTHMAKQLHNGFWSSKCGKLEDMEHHLDALSGLDGFEYGRATCFMKRKASINLPSDSPSPEACP